MIVFATLLLAAGCTNRRTGGSTTSPAAVHNDTCAVAIPQTTGSSGDISTTNALETTVAEEQTPSTATRTWIGPDGSRKRWGPFVENDTTFLFVHEYPLGSDTNRYKVFVRKGPHMLDNPCFAGLSPQHELNWRDFTHQLRKLKKRAPKPLLRHAALEQLSHSWARVRSFRGNYYIDGLNPYPVWISDSLFIRVFMDGPVLSPIADAQRVSPTHYSLRTTAGYDGIDRVNIHIVDTVRKIAVFSFSNDTTTEQFYTLYVPFETGIGIDMVDFYSMELPEDEVEWDQIDFDALISGTGMTPESGLKTELNK